MGVYVSVVSVHSPTPSLQGSVFGVRRPPRSLAGGVSALLRRSGRRIERLDRLLGRDGLVRCAWRIRVAALGLVGT